MHNPLPIIHEDTASLKQRIQQEHNGRKKPRLQMLYLLASGPAQTRQNVAQLLEVHRHTIGHWRAIDATGGLAALLAVSVPAGKPVSFLRDVLDALEQALRQPRGFASCEVLRQWVQQSQHLEVNYHTLCTLVRTRFQTKLKVAQPRHTRQTLRPSRRFR
jgi:hypothetical protein